MKLNYFILIVLIVLISLPIGILIYEENSKAKLSNENQLYKIILRADKDYSKISIDGQTAESYYNEASYFYENQEYKLVESNCRLARDYYSLESQGYKNIKAELLSLEIKDKLIDIYINLLNSDIEITDNMFEACEYLESASRYYDKYYNEINYKEMDYDMGTLQINNMNEKINAHDKAVENYNQYIENFRVELDKRLIEK